MTTVLEAPTMPRLTAAQAADAARAKLTQRELGALQAQLRRELRDDLAAEQRARKANATPRVRETPEVASAARRMVRAVGDRAATDVDALPFLVELRDAVDVELHRAVTAVRDPARQATPWSWADIGRVLGTSKQAAQQRFGR